MDKIKDMLHRKTSDTPPTEEEKAKKNAYKDGRQAYTSDTGYVDFGGDSFDRPGETTWPGKLADPNLAKKK